jgi:RND superfamily putative drug exporter
MTVDDPAFRAAVTGTLARLPKNDVPHVTTFWDTRSPALVSRDRHATRRSG